MRFPGQLADQGMNDNMIVSGDDGANRLIGKV